MLNKIKYHWNTVFIGDYNGELLIENQNFITRAQNYLHAMKNVMSKAPREIKRCDLADNMIGTINDSFLVLLHQ